MVLDNKHATPCRVDVQVQLLQYQCGVYASQELLIIVFSLIRDVLIRFASRGFTLKDFHESIHLCNTTVQLKYRKLPRCSSDIPEELHWNLQNFKDYLQCLSFLDLPDLLSLLLLFSPVYFIRLYDE